MRIKIIAYLVLLIPLTIIGCCSSICGGKLTEYQISWGSGGGVTGKWNGYTINSKTKELTKWSGMIQEKNPEHLKKMCTSKLKTIYQEIEKSGVTTTIYQEPGNMSRYIKITTPGFTNTIIWNYNLQSDLATKLNKFYDFLNKYPS
jgi:hypothetical protein